MSVVSIVRVLQILKPLAGVVENKIYLGNMKYYTNAEQNHYHSKERKIETPSVSIATMYAYGDLYNTSYLCVTLIKRHPHQFNRTYLVEIMKILIISDIHGNADALKAVIEEADRWDAIWVLGDLVDYGPEPHVVVDMVKELKPDIVVAGNHDYAIAYNADCRCMPEIHELSEYTRKFISMKLLLRDQIDWLRALSLRVETTIVGKKVVAVHGSPRNPLYGYLKPSLPRNEILLQLTPSVFAIKPAPIKADIVLVGHTHIPAEIEVEGIRVLNPGSCGQPRDGDPRASYAIYDTESSTFTIRRVRYDIDRVIDKLRNIGLEERCFTWLADILRRGSI